MQFIETGFKDLWLIEPSIFEDQRGYFFEAFNAREFKKATGIEAVFVQQNQSKSTNKVLRGMHLQIGEAAQAKLVRLAMAGRPVRIPMMKFSVSGST